MRKLFLLSLLLLSGITHASEVAITKDDPHVADSVKMSAQERDAKIRAHLKEAEVKELRYPGEDGEYEAAEMDRLGL
jgi:hypothetical protein